MKTIGSISSCRILPNEQNDELKSLRNTPEIVEFAEGEKSFLTPERYPSKDMSVPNSATGLRVERTFESKDEERINKIAEMAEKWEWIPKSDLLFVDFENTPSLFQKLQSRNIPVCRLDDYEIHRSDRFLFLQRSDPIEAIVAGAEWPVLIIHAKVDAVKLFSKRIISRATTKLYVFMDRKSSHVGFAESDVNPRSEEDDSEPKDLDAV